MAKAKASMTLKYDDHHYTVTVVLKLSENHILTYIFVTSIYLRLSLWNKY